MKAKRAVIAARFYLLHRSDRVPRAFAHLLSKPFAEMTRSVRALVCARDSRSLLSRRSFAGVRDDVQTGRPKTVRPALALADFGSKPGAIVITARLRTEALERSTMPYQPELAVAVSAMIFHSFLPRAPPRLNRPAEDHALSALRHRAIAMHN